MKGNIQNDNNTLRSKMKFQKKTIFFVILFEKYYFGAFKMVICDNLH